MCPKLPIDVGGTVDHQSFEGRVAFATGHDPEQGDGTYGVLVLDAPVCAAYALSPQRELLLGVLGIYLNPMRHLLLFVTHIEPAS